MSSTEALIVDTRTRKRAIVDGVGGATLAAPVGPGDTGPLGALDLTLLQGSAGFRPKNASIDVTLPASSGDVATIGPNLRLVLGGNGRGSLIAEGHKVFYANSDLDTDAVLEPTARGAEASWLLRSPGSPEQLSFNLRGVDPAEIKVDSKTGGLLLGPDGQIGSVSAPVATDAQGTSVPATFVVDGAGVRVLVPHRGRDLAYPIAVDPVINVGLLVVQEFVYDGTPRGLPQRQGFGWSQAPNSLPMFHYDDGTTFTISVGSAGGGGSAWWAFDPIRTSSAYRAEFLHVKHTKPSGTCLNIGLFGRSVGWAETNHAEYAVAGNFAGSTNGFFQNCTGTDTIYVTACTDGACGIGGFSADNIVAFQQYVDGRPAGQVTTNAYFDGAYIFHREYGAPTAAVSGLPNGWTNAGQLSATITAHDDGVGLCSDASYGYAPSVEISDTSTSGLLGTSSNGGCAGTTYFLPAPADMQYGWTSGVNQVAEGIRTLNFHVRDAVDNSTNVQKTVSVDRTAPTASIGGRLGGYVTQRLSEGAPLPDELRTMTGSFDVVVSGQESRPGPPTSGIVTASARLVRLRETETADVDPAFTPISLVSSAPSCAGQSNCDLTGVRTAFTDTQLPPGIYQVEVALADQAGNVTNSYYVFARGGGEFTTIVEGQGTARWVPLQASRTAGAPTFATFQWQTGTRPWTTIPAGAVFREIDGAPNGSAAASLSGGVSGRIVLDIEELIRRVHQSDNTFVDLTAGRLQLRAVFDGAGSVYERRSEDVVVRLDRGGRDTTDKTTEIGSGTVDLLTGNFALTATDTTISGYQSSISVNRSYNSRYVLKADGQRFSQADDGPMGPGWTVSLPSDGVSDFVQVVDLDDAARDAFQDRMNSGDPGKFDPAALPEERYAAVRVEAADGSGFVFERRESDGVYVPEAGFEGYGLERQSSSGGAVTERFVLTDRDAGSTTTFGRRLDDPARPHYDGTPEHGTFAVTLIDTPGIPGKPQWRYEKFGSDGRDAVGNPIDKSVQWLPTRVTLAHDGSLNCPTTGQMERGCQALDLTYARQAARSDRYRLTAVSVTATDPSTGSLATQNVTRYEYSADSAERLVRVIDCKSGANPAQCTAGLSVQYAYGNDGLLGTVTPPGDQPYSVTYQTQTDDQTRGRLRTASRATVPGSWTVIYSDRTLGGANPWDLSRAASSQWNQTVTPFRATAIIPPDVNFGIDTGTLQKASISYLDALGQEINHAEPGNRISAVEYDKWGNVTRSLSPQDLTSALADPGNHMQAADLHATFTTYESDTRGGRRPIRVVGPERSIKLKNGTTVRGRSLTITVYDTTLSGQPLDPTDPKMPYNLPTIVVVGAVTGSSYAGVGGTERDLEFTRREFQLSTRQLTAEMSATGTSLQSLRRVIRDSDGKELERRQPSQPGTSTPTNFASPTDATNTPSTTRTTYYTKGPPSDPTVNPACGGRPEWVGLACEVQTAGPQPASGLRKLPVKRIEYDYWRRPTRVVETAVNASGATETRTATISFDGKDRPLDETICADPCTGSAGTVGVPVDRVRHVYDDGSGRETETQQINAAGTILRKVVRRFDTLGRLYAYENWNADPTGTSFTLDNKRTTTFDPLSRPAIVRDSNGSAVLATKTFGYDTVSGYLTSLTDSGLDASSPMTAAYNADGRPTAITYPSGMQKTIEYDEEGAVKRTTFTKTAGCTAACVVYDNVVTRSAQGRIVDDESPLLDRAYSYDALGRLSFVNDVQAGGSCKTRSYTYDSNSNRLVRRSATGSSPTACPAAFEGGSTISSTYDSSDRTQSVTRNGAAGAPEFDAWGRTTRQPTEAVAGLGQLESTYFVNDLAATIKAGSTMVTNTLDPMDRVRTRATATTGQTDVPLETYAYGDDSDGPMFTRGATAANPTVETGWTRYVMDPAGAAAAQVTSAGVRTLEVSNVHGDTVGEMPATVAANALTAKFAVDEFGVPNDTTMTGRKYGFLGTKQREALLNGLIVSMGIRSYSPWTGRFLQTDPVQGGSANTYDYANQDPVNVFDLDGRCARRAGRCQAGTGTASESATIRRTARARGEANRAQEAKDATAAVRAGQGKFRRALIQQSGKTVEQAKGFDAHHMLPAKNAVQFNRLGIDPNNPRYGVLMERTHHRGIGSAFTKAWDEFWDQHDGDATVKLVETFARQLAKDFNITW